MTSREWRVEEERPVVTVARNVSTRVLATIVDAVLGLVMLPFNVAHLGAPAYGLWMLTASVTVHFSVLNLGYGGALVKFIAQYRAQRSVQGLNEIASTLMCVFTAAGCVAYAVAALVAFNLDSLFRLTPEQAEVGKTLLLIIGIQVAMNFPFSIYGGIVTGFQRNHTNSLIAIGSSIAVALVNVAVISAGYGLVALVAATTSVRVVTYFVYRRSALHAYPALELSPSLFRRSRLREVTGFSAYAMIIDWANKLNYQFDTIVIGIFLGPLYVAAWAVANRIILATQMLANQMNGALFPLVVDSDASQHRARLQQILLQGTRMSLAMVLPIATFMVTMGEPLIRTWVGAQMLTSVPILQILAVAVAVRVGNGTGNILLKGAGCHRVLAWVNLSAGIGNVILSILLVRVMGLPGVALGTLAAVTGATVVLYPLACRRAELPVTLVIRRSILPALWPALVVGVLLGLSRDIVAHTLVAVLAHAALAWVVYLAIFFFVAIDRADRIVYTARIRELTDRIMGPRRRAATPGGSTVP